MSRKCAAQAGEQLQRTRLTPISERAERRREHRLCRKAGACGSSGHAHRSWAKHQLCPPRAHRKRSCPAHSVGPEFARTPRPNLETELFMANQAQTGTTSPFFPSERTVDRSSNKHLGSRRSHTVAEVLIELLAQAGVRKIFGVA